MNKIQQKQELRQKLSPKQLLQAKLFQLNSFSLEQQIYYELEKNPLLELSDSIEEDSDPSSDKADDISDDFEIDELYSTTDDFELGLSQSTKKQNFENFNTSKNDIIDDLKEQLRDLNFSKLDIQIAHEIIGNLDKKGYLSIDPFLIADRYNLDIDKIISIKDKIRLLDPPGMASSNIRECLMSQLIFHDFQDSHSYKIIDQYFKDFSKANYDIIQAKLKISKEQIKESLDIISNLSLYPGDGMDNLVKETILPDLIMEKRDNKWVIATNDGSIPEVILNSKYSKMIDDKKVLSKTKTFIKNNYQNATLFLNAIKERKRTMLIVMHTIVDKQPDFFNSDKKFLHPMLLKDIAKAVNLDLSTISRICNGKYVQLPWGIFELRFFFSEGVKMKDGRVISNTLLKADIIEIINNEPFDAPLKDENIVKILDNKGYQIARRTITKYRDLLNIPNSIIRKKIKGL